MSFAGILFFGRLFEMSREIPWKHMLILKKSEGGSKNL